MHRAIRFISIFLFACVAFAQAPPQMPKPGPEHKRLQYYVGEWKNEGEMKASPMGPAGKFTGTDRNQMLGDFFLAMHSDSQMPAPMGVVKSVAVLGFDPKAKVYTFDGFDTTGMHGKSTGTVSGSVWTWNAEEEMGGKKFKGRFTAKEVSPTSYTYKYEMSEDGKTWKSVMEGKATKVK